LVREQGISRGPGGKEELGPQFATASAREVRIEPFEELRPPRRMPAPRAEFPQRGLLEQVVAEENFVGPFSGKHNLDAVLAGKL
jgi:hypothetical protein